MNTPRRNSRKYSKNSLRETLKEWVSKNNRVPTKREFSLDKNLPSEMTFRRNFGSWKKAVISAGFVPPIPRWSRAGKGRTTHGRSKSSEYKSWGGMISRCINKNLRSWKNYGGRGIGVCEKWRKFEGFYADMGPRPIGYQLDRIDVNGDYEPSNCRWATDEQQRNNKRSSDYFTIDGVTKTIGQWRKVLGIESTFVLRYRIKKGWPIDRLNSPVKVYFKKGQRICSQTECGNSAIAVGLCNACYKRKKRRENGK